jgi:hypothetical protein
MIYLFALGISVVSSKHCYVECCGRNENSGKVQLCPVKIEMILGIEETDEQKNHGCYLTEIIVKKICRSFARKARLSNRCTLTCRIAHWNQRVHRDILIPLNSFCSPLLEIISSPVKRRRNLCRVMNNVMILVGKPMSMSHMVWSGNDHCPNEFAILMNSTFLY